MTLLITVFAAVTVTILWYTCKDDRMQLGFLALMYWGAAIMWTIDAVFEFAELKSEYFTPAPGDMLNDAFLGLSAVALGLVVWMIRLLAKDPSGRLRGALRKSAENK